MNDEIKRKRLETEAIVIGYAMSRLDTDYLLARKVSSWNAAFREAATALSSRPASFDNLRDEFDPVHPNPRRGWHNRPMRSSRQRVLDELSDVSDDALIEMVSRILQRDEEPLVEAIDSLSGVTRVAYNVAERLLTGRRAEEYFLAHSARLIQVEPTAIIDCRQEARGYDFGIDRQPERAIEVKGLKPVKGSIQFTDREWREAKQRQENYCLVVVGNLIAEPQTTVIYNPHKFLIATCTYQTSVTAVWRSSVSVRE